MVSLLIMLAILLILFVLALKTSPIIVSPQVGFLIGFIVQIVFCLFYADDWRMNMDLKTIFTIVGGGALFCGISFLCDLIGRSIAPAKERRSTGIGQN